MTTAPISSSVASLNEKPKQAVKGESLWMDAWKRLRRNRAAVLGLIIILLNIGAAVFAPVISPREYDEQELENHDSIPQWLSPLFPGMIPVGQPGGYVTINNDYPLGADNLGRDILTRLLWGARVSLLVAFVGPLVSIVVGVIVGLTAGYAGGAVDNFLMRIVDIMYAFPTLLLIILFMTFFRAGFTSYPPGSWQFTLAQLDKSTGGMLFIFVGIGLTSWMQMARLVRGQVLAVREKEFVLAASALGATTNKIVFQHILPNILGPLIVAETLSIPQYISYEAFLSYIGLGVNPPTPSWGGMIAEGARTFLSAPHQVFFPALALSILVFAFNFLGDGLRDALDPRMRGVD